MPHLVTAKLLGQHSYTIEERAFSDTVALWLQANWPQPERLEYYMSVVARRLLASSFTPSVQAFCTREPLASCLELRVKPPGDQHRWVCHLMCPSVKVAQDILSWARPALFQWREEHDRRVETEGRLLPVGHKAGNKLKKYAQQWDGVAAGITSFSNLSFLCLDLYQAIQAASGETLNVEMIQEAAAQFVTGKKLSAGFVVRFLLPRLVERGFLNPIPAREDFQPTDLLLELADRRYRIAAQQQVEALRKEEGNLGRKLEAALEELRQTEAKVETAKERIATLSEQLAQKSAEVTAADHPVSLFGVVEDDPAETEPV